MKLDNSARYSKSHEWVRPEGELFVYGITDHAQSELSDLVYIELPEVNTRFAQGDIIGAVESVKAASDLYLPIGGEIVAVNVALPDAPDKINQDPYGEGWILKLRAADPAELEALLSPDEYRELIGGE
jgi:glycine cleavage system H protein